jgi:hypothetical protein
VVVAALDEQCPAVVIDDHAATLTELASSWVRICPPLSTAVLAWELLRREDVGDASTAEDGGAHRLDGERREEDPLARTQDDRVD